MLIQDGLATKGLAADVAWKLVSQDVEELVVVGQVVLGLEGLPLALGIGAGQLLVGHVMVFDVLVEIVPLVVAFVAEMTRELFVPRIHRRRRHLGIQNIRFQKWKNVKFSSALDSVLF